MNAKPHEESVEYWRNRAVAAWADAAHRQSELDKSRVVVARLKKRLAGDRRPMARLRRLAGRILRRLGLR